MILVLLALVLAVANVANFLLLRSSLQALRDGEGRLAAEAAQRALKDANPVALGRAMAEPAVTPVEYPPTRLRAIASRQRLLSIDLVAPDSAYLSSTSPAHLGFRDSLFHNYTERDEWHPASGEVWWDGPTLVEGQQAIVHYQPVIGPGGVLAGYLRTAIASPHLARVEKAYRLFAGSQALALLAIVAVAFALSRWIARPYRLMAQAVDEAADPFHPGPAVGDDPDSLVASIRGVLDKLRRQEEELRRIAPASPSAAASGAEADPVAGFLRTFGRTMTSGVLAVDRDARIAGINEAAASLFLPGEAAEAVMGRGVEEALRAADGMVRLVRSVLDGGPGRSRELIPYRAADGKLGTLGVSVSPVAAQGNWTGGVFCLVSDLSEIATLRERARLREGLASVGELSAGIAHEFRNSLAAILGYARLVEREAPGTSAASHAGAITREVQSVRTVVDEFLRFARPGRLARAPVDLGALCAAAAENVRRDGTLERLRVEIEGDLPAVAGDEPALRQAFGNLFRNAAEADPARAVTVRVRAEAVEGGESVRVVISDDGPGIAPENLGRIFLPFFTTKASGTGLGLAITQKTILDHDGAIDVRSRPGEGTTFEIHLPAAGSVSFRNSAVVAP